MKTSGEIGRATDKLLDVILSEADKIKLKAKLIDANVLRMRNWIQDSKMFDPARQKKLLKGTNKMSKILSAMLVEVDLQTRITGVEIKND